MISKKIVLFDNYDSFTHNLYHLISVTFPNYIVEIHRNTSRILFVEEFDLLIGGPGPCTPAQTGILKALFEQKIIPQKIPYLGVCLGMQFLAWYFGYDVHRSSNPIHGDVILLNHQGTGLFSQLPQNFPVARYNSLEISVGDLLDSPFEVLATEAHSDAVMALRHKNLPLYGIQFHPESFLSSYGKDVLINFHQQVMPYD